MANRSIPPIVILHGWAVDQFNDRKWQPLMQALQAQGVEVKFLGLPGLTVPLTEVWNLDNYVAWVEQQLQDESRVILLGHSFGGQIAVRYARYHPDQVSKLILVAAAGIRDQRWLARAKRAVFKTLAILGKPIFKAPFLRKVLYKLAREQDYLNAPPLLRKTMSAVITDEVIDDAPQVQAPTLLIWGQADAVTPPWMAERYLALLPKANLTWIPSARHSPQFTHVSEVVQAIKSFVVA